MTATLTATVFLLLKVMILLGLFLYTLFAVIIVRQEHLMAMVLEERFEPMVRAIALIHLGASVFVFVMAFAILP
jgi:hypothetical protein